MTEHLLKIKEKTTGSDPHSIQNQCLDLAWRDVLYRTYNYSLSMKDNNCPKPNTLVEYIHDSFFESQSMLLRRLLENKQNKKSNAVYSLYTVLEEIKDLSTQITRDNYLDFQKNKVQAENIKWRSYLEESFNKSFDYISDMNLERKSSDIISVSKINNVYKYLQYKDRLFIYNNKSNIHAAAPSNRKKLELDKMTLNYIQMLYRRIIWSLSFIGRVIGEPVLFICPTPQFNPIENWTNSIITKKYEKRLNKYWYTRMKYFEKWQNLYWQTDQYPNSPFRKVDISRSVK